jgi:selenocysteine lyase/cysteine desulfurase
MVMWDEIRRLFPIHEHCTFLNNAGVSPPSTRVLEALEAYHRDHALYGVNKLLPRFMETAIRIKEILGEFLQCPPSCIALTHNTSEGMSIVAQGFRWEEGDCVLGLDREYPANIYPWWNLEKKGVRHLRLKPAHSVETLAALKAGIDDNVRMVAVSAVDWCSGYVLDLSDLGEFCRRRGVTLVVDVAQALGVISLNPEPSGIAAMAGSGWKWLMGPIGTGIFYCHPDLVERLDLVFVGTDTVVDSHNYLDYRFEPKPDASRFEFSTPNVNDWVYLLAAIKLLHEIGLESVRKRILSLNAYLREGLLNKGLQVRGSDKEEEQSGILSFRHETIDAAEEARRLGAEKIYVAARDGAVRVSPHIYNNEEDMDRLLEAITVP